jgi:hypothetical protein
LLEALVTLAVERLPLNSLVEAQRLLEQLERLPEQGRGYWRPLPLEQLERWFASAPSVVS